MKKNMWLGVVAATAFATGAAAQTSTSPNGQMKPSGHDTVTVVGCVQPGNGASTNGSTASGTTTGTTGSMSTNSGSRYVLANAMVGAGGGSSAMSGSGSTGSGSSGSSASGTAGTAGSTGTSGSMSSMSMHGASATYALDGSNTDLQKHVNHKVEITGVIKPASGTATMSGTTGSASASGGTTGSAGTAAGGGMANSTAQTGNQRLEVQAIRMIAATCAAQ